MDLCQLKHSELAKHLPKYRRRVVLQIQSSVHKEHHLRKWQQQDSWKHMSKLFAMVGEANDAVSAHTQVHLSEAPRLFRLPDKERSHVRKKTTFQSKTGSPNGNIAVGKKNSKKYFSNTNVKKYQLWSVFVSTENHNYS